MGAQLDSKNSEKSRTMVQKRGLGGSTNRFTDWHLKSIIHTDRRDSNSQIVQNPCFFGQILHPNQNAPGSKPGARSFWDYIHRINVLPDA